MIPKNLGADAKKVVDDLKVKIKALFNDKTKEVSFKQVTDLIQNEIAKLGAEGKKQFDATLKLITDV